MATIKAPKKLIEVALPLDAINVAAAREKSIRHGHPSTLHLWWARRPLAAARAVLFAQMVNDPGYQQGGGFRYGVNKEKAALERERLFKIVEDLVQWENTNNEEVLERARAEIRRSWRETCELNKNHPQAAELFNPDKLPAFHDPFAGGGALPLEAQRLGLEAYASDLNPVAVTINKAMIEIPPRFAGRAPVSLSLGARASRPHKSWHSRGYLPHFDQPGLLQSVTFRLADAVPTTVIEGWRAELQLKGDEPADDPRCTELRERIERYADAGHGECWLRQPNVAQIVQDALLYVDGERYRLLAWCVMPNHVHVLIETKPGYPLGDIVHTWKSFTAKAGNRALSRTGAFWMPDYFDRFIRDDAHLRAALEYIENNPVKAGLVSRPQTWAYSSASSSRMDAGETPALPGLDDWTGARGLAEDVRRYGAWMRAEAQKRIGHLYPQVEVTRELAADRPDLQPLVGKKLTVIAWLWARTVKSPNPAFSHVAVPLASTFVLSSKAGKEAYVEPVLGTRASGPQAGEAPALPTSTGWETFLEAVIRAGFAITGTWPMRTELGNRVIGSGTNALASSIVLVCRRRAHDAPTVSRREFLRELNATLPEALADMINPGSAPVSGASGRDARVPVAPVDLSQAIIGPGMAIFSQYAAVLEADGTPMSVKTALALINRFLAEDDFDHDTQFCLHWFEQQGWATGKFGEADVLARAKGTSVGGLQEAGVIESGGGKLRLLRWAELPRDWSPETDTRTPVWEALHQMIRALNQDGESAAGALLARMPARAEPIRALAYRLYTLCERKGWTDDARAYNELVTAWSAIEQAAGEAGIVNTQVELDF